MSKDDNRPDWTWVSTLPGVIGTSIFSVTQAQSASGSELYHGKMPLWRRDVLGAAARAGVSLYILYGAMATAPSFNPYARELVRQAAMSSFTLACFLQLTTARQVASQRARPAADATEVTSWKPAVRWGLWLIGRALIGFGPALFVRGYYTYEYIAAGESSSSPGFRRHGLLRTGGNVVVDVGVGAAMTTAGVVFDLLATAMMRRDGLRTGHSNLGTSGLLLGATLGTASLVTYRGVVEYAKDRLSQDTLWVSILPGMLGAALVFATVPILFSFAELQHGDIPIEQRDRLTRTMRSLAGMGFPLWCAMSAIPGFNPFGREAVLIGTSLCFQLANALPTTTTRRGRPQFAFPRTPGLSTPRSAISSPEP